jgi:hypothetical protein
LVPLELPVTFLKQARYFMSFRSSVSIALLSVALVMSAWGQTVTPSSAPTTANVVGFVGISGDPNGSVNDVQADLGVAKLISSSTYLGIVAHLSKGIMPGQRLSTKVQLHIAQQLFPFRGATFYWTGEVGPEFTSQLLPQGSAAAAGAAQLQVGYAVGSGPMISIPIGHAVYLAPHVEAVKGSLQDLGWRGGVLFMFGDK